MSFQTEAKASEKAEKTSKKRNPQRRHNQAKMKKSIQQIRKTLHRNQNGSTNRREIQEIQEIQ